MGKGYLVFAGLHYYPYDFICRAVSVDEAKSELLGLGSSTAFDWWQIVDADTFEIVEKGGRE
jgi:hypothetical protein